MGVIMNFRLVSRMLVLMTAVLPGVAVVMDMRVHRMSMFMGVLMEMLMRVRVGVLMEVNHILLVLFMGMLMRM
jgi:hypothetical protein